MLLLSLPRVVSDLELQYLLGLSPVWPDALHVSQPRPPLSLHSIGKPGRLVPLKQSTVRPPYLRPDPAASLHFINIVYN